MKDLERLDAALAYEDGEFVDPPEDGTDTQSIILAAARVYRDLFANGERVEWCEAHSDVVEYRSVHGEPMRCAHAELLGFDNCKFVSRLLVDHPEEGTE